MKEKYIPGIYNYCDRWCERCSFTSRCRNYDNSSKLTPEQLDINNKAFWENISDNFTQAVEMLYAMANEKGIDLGNLMTKEEEEAYEQRRSLIDKTVKDHELTRLCKKYRVLTLSFFKTSFSQHLVDKNRELVDHLQLGMHNEEEVVYTMKDLGDCQEVIQWYVFFIAAKLQRALRGKMENDEDENYLKDSDGSAKIAIMAIERSMGAWKKIFDLLPASEDTALAALAILSQLKQKALNEFPGAMHFKRPGFDD